MLIATYKHVIDRYLNILITETRMSSIVLGWWGVLLSIGFLIGDTSGNGYAYITEYAGTYAWSFGFLSYGLAKLVQSIYRLPIWLRLSISLQGMWCWSFILLSVFIYNNENTLPGQVLFLFPLILEIWDAVAYMYSIRNNNRRDVDR